MRIGLDIHGVIDKYPELFRKLSKEWVAQGHLVHIITGQEWENAKLTVDDAGINYTHQFSIVDHHRELGTLMYKRSDKNGWWMESGLWVRSKGDYATSVGLDLHFDDNIEYAKYFPKSCTYIIVPSENFDTFTDKMLIV